MANMADVVQALVQATTTQQQTNAVQQAATATMQEHISVLQQLVLSQKEEQQKITRAMQQEIQDLSQRLERCTAGMPQSAETLRVSDYLQKMAAIDDVEAYLMAFERTAEREGWPVSQWASLLAPFLSGEPQKAYYDLEPAKASDYDTLKAEILARMGVTTAVRAQRFNGWKLEKGRTPRSQMFDLIYLARKWLRPETKSPEQIIESLVLDRYLRALPNGIREWVTQGNPLTYDAMIEQVERCLLAKDTDYVPGARASRTGSSPQNDHPRKNPISCFACGAKGHVRARCPNLPEVLQCGLGEGSSDFCGPTCLAASEEGRHTFQVPVLVGKQETVALIDSGSALNLVTSRLVKPSWVQKGDTVGVLCVHGGTVRYPTAKVELLVQGRRMKVPAVVVPRLPCPLVLGRDFPLFPSLLQLQGKMELREPVAKLGSTGVHESFLSTQAGFCIPHQKGCLARGGCGKARQRVTGGPRRVKECQLECREQEAVHPFQLGRASGSCAVTVERRAVGKRRYAAGLSRRCPLGSMVAHPTRSELRGRMCDRIPDRVIEGSYVPAVVLHPTVSVQHSRRGDLSRY